MLGQNHVDILSNPSSGHQGRHIDKDLIKKYLTSQTENCYICGPDEFVAVMKNYLIELGVAEDKIVIEQ